MRTFRIISNKTGQNLSLVMIFIISFLYFCFFDNYIFFFQENQLMFIYSGDYISQFVSKPGGMLMYAGNFLTQFYFNSFYGSLLLSALIVLLGLVILKIIKRVSTDESSPVWIMVITACLLLLVHTNFNWLIYNDLGFLLGVLFFLFSIRSDSKRNRAIVLFLFPLFYYLAGAYAWITLGMQIAYSILYGEGRLRFSYPILFLVVAATSLLIFKEVLFFQTGRELLKFPLPFDFTFTNPLFFYILAGLIVLLPLIIGGSLRLKHMVRRPGIVSRTVVPVIFIATIFLLYKLYDPKIANLFRVEELVFDQDWEAVIEYQEEHRSANMIAQYYYNLALSEQGELCDRMFHAPQDYGPNALIISWGSGGIRTIFRGAYFFYSVGLINEAHRWAYESMVSQGFFPENIKLLIETDLINGHYRTAGKYIDILKKTLHYRHLAKRYEKMIDAPSLIDSDPVLGEKKKLLPGKDFTIRITNPQSNIPLLLFENTGNRKAYEYLMAWYLLQKNVEAVYREAGRMSELGYSRIPAHIEEALVVYALRGGNLPETGELQISREVRSRFLNYSMFAGPMGADPSFSREEFNRAFGNTYWVYLDSQ